MTSTIPEPAILSSLEWTEETSAQIILAFSSAFLVWVVLSLISYLAKFRKWVKHNHFTSSAYSALIGIVVGYMSPTSVWPQPQTSLAALAVLQAQASSTAFCNTEGKDTLDKLMDVIGVALTIFVVFKASYAYPRGAWGTFRNPRNFAIVALVVEGSCSIIWVIAAFIGACVPTQNKKLLVRSRRDKLIAVVVFATSCVAIIFTLTAGVESYDYDADPQNETPLYFVQSLFITATSLFIGTTLQFVVAVESVKAAREVEGSPAQRV